MMPGVSVVEEEVGERKRCQQRMTLRRGRYEVGSKPGDLKRRERSVVSKAMKSRIQ